MKNVRKKMIKKYKLNKIGLDFMGYSFDNASQLSFHHLIIPKRNNGPDSFENGAILTQSKIVNSHDYLHLIERIDPEIFYNITSELIDENIKGKIDIENLKQIRDLLLYFENEHYNDKDSNGNVLIKKSFVDKRWDLL